MDEVAYHEICQAYQQYLPGVSQHTVHHANNEDEDRLRQEKSIAEYGRLDEFRVV